MHMVADVGPDATGVDDRSDADPVAVGNALIVD